MLGSHVLGQWWHRTHGNGQAMPGLTSCQNTPQDAAHAMPYTS